MIIAHLFGGLGNQMFQYAMARQHASLTGAELLLDAFSYRTDTAREFSLHHLAVGAPLARWRDVASLCPGVAALRLIPRPLHDRLWRRLESAGIKPPCRVRIREASTSASQIPLREGNLVRERQLTYDPAVPRVGDDCLLVGCWHQARYFDKIRVHLSRAFQPAAPLPEDDQPLAQEIAAKESVAIHVRRGDKVGRPDFKATSASYCDRAMHLVRERIPAPEFFIFSDDASWAERHLGHHPNVRVASNGVRAPHLDFALMRACRHHITAASSLSWWAAWLNDRPDCIIVAPPAWHWIQSPGYDTSQVLPEGWIIVDAEAD